MSEIKEILDKPKILMLSYGNYISLEDYVKLKDYITNLEQENERLKEKIENLTTMTVCGDRKQIKNTAQYKLDIYKLRIDKAIKELKKYRNIKEYCDGDMPCYCCVLETLENILTGGDE